VQLVQHVFRHCEAMSTLDNMSPHTLTTSATLQTNICNIPTHPDTSRHKLHNMSHTCLHMSAHVCTCLHMSAHVCTNVAHMSAHVCKGSAKLCKGSAKPRKPPKPRKVLCRAFAGPETGFSGFPGSRREKTPNPGIGPFGPHLPLYKRLKVSKLRQKSTNSRRF
jgi:hypothetical protein